MWYGTVCLLYIVMEVGSNIPFPDDVRFSAGSQQCCVCVNDIMKMYFNLLHALHNINNIYQYVRWYNYMDFATDEPYVLIQ